MGWQGFTWYRGSVQGLTGGAQVDDRENFGDDREREGIFLRTGFFRVSYENVCLLSSMDVMHHIW